MAKRDQSTALYISVPGSDLEEGVVLAEGQGPHAESRLAKFQPIPGATAVRAQPLPGVGQGTVVAPTVLPDQ